MNFRSRPVVLPPKPNTPLLGTWGGGGGGGGQTPSTTKFKFSKFLSQCTSALDPFEDSAHCPVRVQIAATIVEHEIS